tara:strand:- start:138 stop:1547 length:1410 start_codon:yes stop_codon:yes gene_type:complete
LIFLKSKIKNFNFTFFLKKTSLIILFFSRSFSQLIDTEIHLLDNKKSPFWILSNNHSIYSKGSIINFKISEELKKIHYGAEIIFPLNQGETPLFNQTYIRLNNKNFYFQIGKKSNYHKYNYLSSGSLLESVNAMPISKILISSMNYNSTSFLKNDFQYLIKMAHGLVKNSEYIKNPYLHEKSINIKKEISENSHICLGLNHMAVWGGETIQHGKQPASLIDYFRIIFAMPGSKKSTSQDQKNALGNHLGVWNFSYEKKFKNKILKLYIEHPFEDESGARWLLNEFDGLYGLNISRKESYFISDFTYEHINTMNQSGSEGASDSTYGWDNYYNHYIYQSGWTNNGTVIGNPLFTIGSNEGRYSNGQYIINNRIKAHHIGFQGSISNKVRYKVVFTFSENFGIYPDEDFFKSKNKVYRFDGGLIQRSSLVELKTKNLYDTIDVSLVYGIDSGELLNKTDSFMLKINHRFDI